MADRKGQKGGGVCAAQRGLEVRLLLRAGGQGLLTQTSQLVQCLRRQGCDLFAVEVASLGEHPLEVGGVEAPEAGLLGQHEAEQGGPPCEVQLGVDEVVVDVTSAQVRGEVLESGGAEVLEDRHPLGKLTGPLGVLGEPLHEVSQLGDVHPGQVRMGGGQES